MKYGEGQLRADAYTLKAQVKLRCVEENQKMQKAIRDGDQKVFLDILKHAVDYRLTWGDHIRRFIYDSIAPGHTSLEDLSDETVMDFIRKAFRDNGMANRGSMNPKTTTKLGARLKEWMASPAVKISRQTCFLFCFGLNMDEEQASYMLTYVLRQADFNVRDPKEAIYYYCLKYNLQYTGVVSWLEWYDTVEPGEDDRKAEAYSGTLILKRDLYSLEKDMDDKPFKDYLRRLKSNAGDEKKNSRTRAAVLKGLLNELSYSISGERCEALSQNSQAREVVYTREIRNIRDYTRKQQMLRRLNRAKEAVDYQWLEQELLATPDGTVEIPEILGEMIREKIIEIPTFPEKSLEKKISDRETEITREDILMAVFLYCTCGMGDAEVDGGESYPERKAEFVYEANRNLDKCGFSEIYLPNPFELFLVSCLLQKRPLNYFLTVWKACRRKTGDGHGK